MPTFTNWARNQGSNPAHILMPSSEAQLCNMVAEATARGGQVRVVGAHHSWSDVVLTNDTILSLDRLSGIVDIDAASHRVTVWGGTRLYQLNEALASRGLALSNLGSVAEQSIAGALTCGTHGSGVDKPILASSMVGCRLVLADGSVRIIDEHHDAELLDAARVSLGALGVISQLVLQVEPAFNLKETSTPTPIDQVISDMQAIAASGEFVKVWWLPHTGAAQVYCCTRTTEAGQFNKAAYWFDETVVNGYIFPLVLWLSALIPAMVPLMNRLIALSYFKPRTRVARSDRILNVPMPPRHLELEYAIPLEAAGKALAQMKALIIEQELRVNFVAEVRFVAADNAWLSPAQGRATAYLGAYIGACPDQEAYMNGCEAIFKALGGRPHWGKLFSMPAAELAQHYPGFDRFKALRRSLDPTGTFKNAFVDRVLGDN